MKVFNTLLFAILMYAGAPAQQVVKHIAETFPTGATKVLEYYEGVKSEATLVRRETMTAAGIKIHEEKFYQGKKYGKDIKWDPFTEKEIQEYYYENGILEGDQLQWYSDGKEKAIFKYSQGRLNGEQIAYLLDGKPRIQLNFANGVLHGMQREWFDADNSRYHLNFVAGKLDGSQRWWDSPNTDPTTETWTQGSFEEVIEQFPASKPKNTKVYEYVVKDPSTFENPSEITVQGEKKQTKEIEYYETGSIKSLSNITGGKASTKMFYSQGTKMAEGPGTISKPEGLWTWFHENGNKKTEGSFVNGIKKGTFSTWDKDGKLMSEEVFTGFGDQRDAWKVWFYHPNGAVESEGELDQKGRKTGLWTTYYPSKEKMREEMYKSTCNTPGARPFAVRISAWDPNNAKTEEGNERQFTRYTYYPNGSFQTISIVLRPYHINCSQKTLESYQDGKMVKETTIIEKTTGESVDPDREIFLRKATLAESGDTLKVEEFNEQEKLNGTQKGWFEGGKRQYEFAYRDGKPYGDIKEWYPSGAPMLELYYHHVGDKSLEIQNGNYYREDGKVWDFSATDGKDKKKKIVEIEDLSYFKKFLAEH